MSFHARWQAVIVAVAVMGVTGSAQASMSLYPPQHVLTKSVLDVTPDPVSAGDGAFYFSMPLLELGGPMNLGFTLHYNSNGARSNWDLNDLPEGGPWWWDPMATLQPNPMGGTNYWQFQIEDGKAVAFTEEADGSWRLTDETDFGLPNSPIAFQAKRTNTWAYFFDPRNGRIKVFENFTNNLWRIAAQTDRNGNALTYAYRPATNYLEYLQPIRIEDDFGRWYEIEYATQGYNWEYFIDTVTDHAGREVHFEYETGGDISGSTVALRHVVDVMGGTNRFTYAPFTNEFTIYRAVIGGHRLPEGNTPWMQEYDAFPLYAADQHNSPVVIRQTDAYGNTITLNYDTNAHTVAAAWPDGGSNHFAHAGRHQPPLEATDPAGGQTLFAINANQQVESVTDRSGGVTSFGFDPDTRLATAITNPSGDALTFDYVATTQAVVNPITLDTVEFVFHDLVARHYPDGTSETFEMDGRGNVTERVDRAGGRWSYDYDAHGSLLRRVDPSLSEMRFTYTSNGLMESASQVGVGTNIFTYNNLSQLTTITYPDDTFRQYAYDVVGRVTAVSNSLGETWSYAYDANGNLTRAVGPTGAESTYAYDLMDRLVTKAPSYAEATHIEYDAMGAVARTIQGGITNEFQRDALGHVTEYQRGRLRRTVNYDASGRPVTVAQEGHGSTEIQRDVQGVVTGQVETTGFALQIWRDANGVVTQAVDSLGRTTAWSLDDGRRESVEVPLIGADQRSYANGRLAGYTDRDGGTWGYGYTPDGLLSSVTNPVGDVRQLAYNDMGQVVRVILENGAMSEYGYDENGGLTSIITPGSSTWHMAHNALGQPLQITNPEGGVQTLTYTEDGLLATTTDSDGGGVSNAYDGLRRLTQRIRADGTTSEFSYEPTNGWLAAQTSPGGNVWRRTYDEYGRNVSLVDPDGVTNTAEYDAFGCVTAAVVRAETRVAFSYDAAGRLTETIGPEGIGRQMIYNDLDQPVAMVIAGITNHFEYDSEGRITVLSNSLLGTERFLRDARGVVTSRVDAVGNETRYVRDEMGRVVEIEPPSGPSVQMAYNADGALTRIEMPGGIVETYAVDELGGLNGWTDPNGESWTVERSSQGRVEATVDPLQRTNQFFYNVNGWLTGIEFPDGATRTYHYDLDGAVTSEVYSADGKPAETLTWNYDALGNMVATEGLELTHDTMGRVVATVCHGETHGTAYDGAGRLTALDYGGIMSVTYQYEPGTARVTNQYDSLTGTQIAYDYDTQGRLESIRRSNGQNAAFTRRADGMVTRVVDGTVLDLEYAYDANGRLTSVGGTWPLEAGPNLDAGTTAWTYDAAGQISSEGYTYNERGQTTTSPGRNITWRDDQPAVVDGMTLSYSGLDHLLELDGSATPTKLYYNLGLGDMPVRENNRLYVWSAAGQLLYFVDRDSGNAVYVYHPDAEGSILAISDGSGEVVQAYAYDPTGQRVAESGSIQQPFTFGGEHGTLRMDAFASPVPLGNLAYSMDKQARDGGNKGDLYAKGKQTRDGETGNALWKDEAQIDRFVANYDALIAKEQEKINELDEKMNDISGRISDARTYGNNPFYWTAGLILAVVDDENYWPDNAWHNYDEVRRKRADVMNRQREFEREKRKWEARKDALQHQIDPPDETDRSRELDKEIDARENEIEQARGELRKVEKNIQNEEDGLRKLKLINKYSIPYLTDSMDKKLEDDRVEKIMGLQKMRNDWRRRIDRLKGEIGDMKDEQQMDKIEAAISEAQLLEDFLKAAAPVLEEKIKKEGGSHRRGWVKGLRVVDELKQLVPEDYQPVYEEIDTMQQEMDKSRKLDEDLAEINNVLDDVLAVPPPKTKDSSATIENTFVAVPAFAPVNFDEKAACFMPGVSDDFKAGTNFELPDFADFHYGDIDQGSPTEIPGLGKFDPVEFGNSVNPIGFTQPGVLTRQEHGF